MALVPEAGQARSMGWGWPLFNLHQGPSAAPSRVGVRGEEQMDVCRGEKTGRADSIYNSACSVTNAAKRNEPSRLFSDGSVRYFCVVVIKCLRKAVPRRLTVAHSLRVHSGARLMAEGRGWHLESGSREWVRMLSLLSPFL